MEWLVEFELPKKAGSDGWIIQQVQRSYDIRLPDGKVADPKLNAPKALSGRHGRSRKRGEGVEPARRY